ncbi:hypothetical protein [Janibacter limosus]|uniref:hypothetical protein n=1 Tax=Janibacter limosus TaxID=53458 RepID=UPI000837612F|nr:hypothetical protein [Janibacter limosus]
MSENFDEVTSDATRAIRMALMLGSQAAEQLARVRAQQERRAAEASRERASEIREQLDIARDAARAAYEPVADPRRFAQADPETVAAAWSTAAAWADVDPRAAAAEASLAEQTRQRWGVDPHALREHVARAQDEVRADRGQGQPRTEPGQPSDLQQYEEIREEIRAMRAESPDWTKQHIARVELSFEADGSSTMDHERVMAAAGEFTANGEVPSWFLDATWDAERDPRTPRPLMEHEEATMATDPEGVAVGDDRLVEAMDPDWRESATTDDLEQRWYEANADLGQPGAVQARDALEATMAERLGVDLERFRRESEPTLTETAFNAAGDRAAEAADRAAEASERTESAGWENRGSEERGREGAAEVEGDSGLAIEESVDAREAEGMAVRADAQAEADHAAANESRADAEGMEQAGVPPRSQQVRTNTARGFGSTPTAGAQAKRHPKARKNTRSAGKTAERDMGR